MYTCIQRAPRPHEPTDGIEEEHAQPTSGNHQDVDQQHGAESSSHAVQHTAATPLGSDTEQVVDDVSHDGRLGVHGITALFVYMLRET